MCESGTEEEEGNTGGEEVGVLCTEEDEIVQCSLECSGMIYR